MVYRDCTKGICNRIDKINIESAQECRNACDGLMSIDCQSWDWGEKSSTVSVVVKYLECHFLKRILDYEKDFIMNIFLKASILNPILKPGFLN